jgi:hypothetical protein
VLLSSEDVTCRRSTSATTGSGEPLSHLLRPGNAGSNTAQDHIAVIREALVQLPGHRAGTRPGRKILVRIDSARATHDLLDWIVAERLSYSVGFTLPDPIVDELATIPESDWQPAYDVDREPRDGAWVLEVTRLLDLSRWPKGMRVIVRKERPHAGAQLRLTDADGRSRVALGRTVMPPPCRITARRPATNGLDQGRTSDERSGLGAGWADSQGPGRKSSASVHRCDVARRQPTIGVRDRTDPRLVATSGGQIVFAWDHRSPDTRTGPALHRR